jgi:hypothetical protein
LKQTKHTVRAWVTIALTIFFLSPADDVILAAVFGTALFGFGSLPFCMVLIGSSTVSVALWIKHHNKKQNAQQVRSEPFFKKDRIMP